MTHGNRVKPANPPWTTGYDPVFMTNFANVGANLIVQLGWERTSPNPRAVGFADANDRIDLVRSNARPSWCTGSSRIRRGNVWVGTIVDIQHRTLRTFKQYFFAGIQFIVNQQRSVGNVFLQFLTVLVIFIKDVIKFERFNMIDLRKQLVFSSQVSTQLFGKDIAFQQIAHPNSCPCNLVHVGWANPLLRRANLLVTLGFFLALVKQQVVRQGNVGAVRDSKAIRADAIIV